jgi:hypothetical protein
VTAPGRQKLLAFVTERRIQLERVRRQPCFNPESNTETRYRVFFEREDIGVWRDPECAAARYLIDNGLASREDVLRAYRGDTPCLTGSVGWFADRRVTEDDKHGSGTPRFVRWRPNPFKTRRGVEEKPASDGRAGGTPPNALAGENP